jgi:hypothetical protein
MEQALVHGHANMEIITIPLEGALKHHDSMRMMELFVFWRNYCKVMKCWKR